jgi:phosphoribosylanthranilate isomerase
MPRVKVCGLTREQDLAAAVAAGVDAVGAIVDVPVDTPRELSPDAAADLFETTPPFVTTVLVTMPDAVDRARQLVDRVEPDVLQIHDGVAPEGVVALGEDVSVLAGVTNDEPDIEAYAAAADGLVVDTAGESGAGGTGRAHDWTATRDVGPLSAPIVLAGGLTPGNVAEAVSVVEPHAVDVSSGVEVSPGMKDHDLIEEFVAAATEGGA